MHSAYALTIILLIISILLIVWLIWSYINAEEPIEQQQQVPAPQVQAVEYVPEKFNAEELRKKYPFESLTSRLE